MNKFQLHEKALKEIRKNKYNVAILPLGSTEPHNMHLPYGTDFYIADALARKVCEIASKKGAKVIQLPPMPYAVNTNLLEFPMTISMQPSTLDAVITDITKSLEKHGIYKLVILNGHGGNQMRGFLRELYTKTKVFVTVLNWWDAGIKLEAGIFERPGEHADEKETSMLLDIFPETVNMKNADDGAVRRPKVKSFEEGWCFYVRPWKSYTKNTGYGDPRKSTRQKGQRYISLVSEKIAKMVVELSKAKMAKGFPY
ncbi:MAG: hypothetical protein A2297_05240 [Elusimicrobia bacterium RIFOXYB2_FULL_48_7]|nr:MAG: hypothetical protein A2297_05240 [Elusimicrobia bacterium RIFOXYB2_FULL_48_7]